MSEQTIPSSYGGGVTRSKQDNPYTLRIDQNYVAAIWNPTNMANYASRYISNYQSVSKIPNGHLPEDLDPSGYEEDWSGAFANMYGLETLPSPFYNWNGATNLSNILLECGRVIGNIPTLPEGVKNLRASFYNCHNLTGSIPKIPNSVETIDHSFYDCSNLTGSIPDIPENVTNMSTSFYNCSDISGSIPNIPSNVTNMAFCFSRIVN